MVKHRDAALEVGPVQPLPALVVDESLQRVGQVDEVLPDDQGEVAVGVEEAPGAEAALAGVVVVVALEEGLRFQRHRADEVVEDVVYDGARGGLEFIKK